jgi:hypothetical protein
VGDDEIVLAGSGKKANGPDTKMLIPVFLGISA